MDSLTPKAIVEELDRFIIGQHAAKRAVAVAIRNRWRRQQLTPEMAREIVPKNIIMIGPTGVGKTEIARRLAKLTGAPFVKVEASKFTEVGYHGRDVESMIRDLLDQAISMVRAEQAKLVKEKAQVAAEDRLLDLLLPPTPSSSSSSSSSSSRTSTPVYSDAQAEVSTRPPGTGQYVDTGESQERRTHTRERLREQLRSGKLDEREVEISISEKPMGAMMLGGMGMDQMSPELGDMLERMMPEQHRRRRVTVGEGRRILTEQETDKLLDNEKITTEAIERTEQGGIVFLDEIDKVASPSGDGGGRGPDISRQGVQRDLLPIVEGSAINTRYGVVHTDHILFVAAGAFHSAAVSDLMPELQGRFPIRVELSALTRDDFVRILTEPGNALTKQQQELLGVEGIEVSFEAQAIETIADYAAKANATLENIGARRLMTIIEKLFEQINFDAPERAAAGDKSINVTASFVEEQVGAIVADEDLSKFVL